jgi:uncharacterized protein YgiM (DUF1202 family)
MNNLFMKILLVAMATILFTAALLNAAELQQANKNDNLREKPFVDGKILLAIKSGQTVAIQKREGSWYFVMVGKTTGWLPMLSVRRTKPAAVAAKGSTVQTGRSSTGTIVNTTGVRGLNEETLKTASFSEEAVSFAEKYRVLSAADVAAFAVAGGLAAQAVPTLTIKPSTPIGGKK